MSGLLTRVREWLGTTDEASEETPPVSTDGSGAMGAPPLEDLPPAQGKCRSKADILKDLGMTPEAYLQRMVKSAGGRIRQQTIAERTGWSAPTVSRTLSAMEDEGLVERVRIGRGKVVYLPGEGPGDASTTSQPGTDAASEEGAS